MNETQFAEAYAEAQAAVDRLKVVTGDARDALLLELSENTLVLRETAIREHLNGCSVHTDCGWGETPEPNNSRNDLTWESSWRQGLLAEVAEGIKTGTIAPWTPQPKLVLSDLPFYRAR
jgi:hypothetical protein